MHDSSTKELSYRMAQRFLCCDFALNIMLTARCVIGFPQNSEDLYGFLFKHYQERRFWWEMLVLLRKLGFALIIHQPKAPEQQTLLGIMCLLPYIALVNGVRPYSHVYLNWMDMLGASFATSLALSGLVMFGGYDTQLTTDQVCIPTVNLEYLNQLQFQLWLPTACGWGL